MRGRCLPCHPYWMYHKQMSQTQRVHSSPPIVKIEKQNKAPEPDLALNSEHPLYGGRLQRVFRRAQPV